ncbi:MAG: hypothetical protein ACXVB9_17630 [Bdellovibrionota bacterium]
MTIPSSYSPVRNFGSRTALLLALLGSLAFSKPALAVVITCPDGTVVGPLMPPDPCAGHGGTPHSRLPNDPDPPPPGTPPPAPPPGPRDETLGLKFTFTNEADCERKIGAVTGPKLQIPEDKSPAGFCRAFYPSGLRDETVHVILPAIFHFEDEASCVSATTTDLADSGASVMFPHDESAESYCAGLFPPGSPPPGNPPPPAPPPPPPHRGGTNVSCLGTGNFIFAPVISHSGSTYSTPLNFGGALILMISSASEGRFEGKINFGTGDNPQSMSGTCQDGVIKINANYPLLETITSIGGNYGVSGTWVVMDGTTVYSTSTSNNLIVLNVEASNGYAGMYLYSSQ